MVCPRGVTLDAIPSISYDVCLGNVELSCGCVFLSRLSFAGQVGGTSEHDGLSVDPGPVP